MAWILVWVTQTLKTFFWFVPNFYFVYWTSLNPFFCGFVGLSVNIIFLHMKDKSGKR